MKSTIIALCLNKCDVMPSVFYVLAALTSTPLVVVFVFTVCHCIAMIN